MLYGAKSKVTYTDLATTSSRELYTNSVIANEVGRSRNTEYLRYNVVALDCFVATTPRNDVLELITQKLAH